ncbi:malonate decarboxylase subunit alpha [Lentisphaerota bacterium ZTH]|nr:malonate decarboxylase subunit alpha [Lentisphaerota bacterium]WET05373.1 malonate decarboxylase subunit alpha [Lentisphaerota bacterium ZTH]
MTNSRKASRLDKLDAARRITLNSKVVQQENIEELLSRIITSGNKVCIEGDNQKQADFLSRALLGLDPDKINNLHILISTIGLPEQLDIFETGLASRLDLAYAGPQGFRLARMLKDKQLEVGNIHTYNELYARYFMDLRPDVCLLCGVEADRHGNIYMNGSVEDSSAIVEATAFQQGIVVVQVNHLVEKVRRVDIPADWVDFVVETPRHNFHLEPLFTRDPAQITESMILMGMMTMKGIYAKYLPRTLNHGVGFNTAAIELMLPTYGEELGLKGKALTNWVLNPHPTMIPAIEEGWVESIIPPGNELGMEKYVESKPDIFPVGADGSLHSSRLFAQLAGHYSADIFVGASLQIDALGNSSTVTGERITGFGGAPNFGCDAGGRRHTSDAWLKAGREFNSCGLPRGRKLVVQIVETFQQGLKETFVENLDAMRLAAEGTFPLPPVMIYGEDVSHIVTEEGIANLLMCRTADEREQAIRGVAGYTGVGMKRNKAKVAELHQRGIIQRPEDIGISKLRATRDMLSARNIKDLVRWSDGLYEPPSRFRNW